MEVSFDHSQDIDKYYWKFITQADYLVNKQEILQCDVNLLFFQGIPDMTCKKVHKGLPMANQKISNPLTVDVTLGLLWKEFNEMDIDTVVREVDLHKLLDNEESSDLDIEDMPRERFKLKPKKKTVWRLSQPLLL